MVAVLTTSMTLRIILSVRGTLEQGGVFALSYSVGASSRASGRSRNPTNISTQPPYTLDDLRSKPESQWGPADPDNNSSINEAKAVLVPDPEPSDNMGVKVTIDKHIDGYKN
jgi:hypothetical protein